MPLSCSPDAAWGHVRDLSRFDEWLTIHEGWRSPIPGPDELGTGTTVSSVVRLKGARVRFEWTVEQFDPPREIGLRGKGKGGVKVTLRLRVDPAGDGSVVIIDIDLGGLPMIGPAGAAAAALLGSDLQESLTRFEDTFIG